MAYITVNFDRRFDGEIPSSETRAGIYVVFAKGGSDCNPTWVLLDIGQGGNIYDRHSRHERKGKWERYASDNRMTLVYYTAGISNEHSYRDIAEAALLYHGQPIVPTDGKSDFHHEDSVIEVKGKLENYFKTFPVERSAN